MEKTELRKNLGFFSATMTVIGMVIGTGVFFKPQALYSATGAPGLGLICWLFAGVISIAAALTCCELVILIGKTGGKPVWLGDVFGERMGFVAGWFDVILFYPGSIAAYAYIFGVQAVSLMGVDDCYIIPIAAIALLSIVVINCLGNKAGAAVQTFFTLAKLVPLVLILVVGLKNGDSGMMRLLPITDSAHPVMTSMSLGLLACMQSYDGWIGVGNMYGEMKNPEKNLPKAIIGGLSAIIVIYLLINIAYLFVIPASELALTETPAADVAMRLFGGVGGKIITIGILISSYGVVNGNVMTLMRIPYAMALDNKLPFSGFLSKLNPKTAVPVNAGIVEFVICMILLMSGTFNTLTDMFTFVNWIFYEIMFLAMLCMRKKFPEKERPFKCPGYPVLPIVALIGGAFMLVGVLMTGPTYAFVGMAITATAYPVYYLRRNKFKKAENE